MAKKTAAKPNGDKPAPSKETAIVKPEDGKFIKDANSGKPVINWSLVEPAVREKMLGITNGLREAFTSVRVGFLKIGALLSEAEMIMKPRGMWVQYLNSWPNFKQAQAYRYINGYLIAQKAYPPAVLDVILSTGMDLIGTKDRPYGKYTDVVKKLPPPKDADAGKALAWCNKVEAAYASSRKKENKGAVNTQDLLKDAFLSITKKYHQVPEKKQLQWVRSLFAYTIGYLGMKQDETISPLDPPANFLKKKKADAEGESSEVPEQGE